MRSCSSSFEVRRRTFLTSRGMVSFTTRSKVGADAAALVAAMDGHLDADGEAPLLELVGQGLGEVGLAVPSSLPEVVEHPVVGGQDGAGEVAVQVVGIGSSSVLDILGELAGDVAAAVLTLPRQRRRITGADHLQQETWRVVQTRIVNYMSRPATHPVRILGEGPCHLCQRLCTTETQLPQVILQIFR